MPIDEQDSVILPAIISAYYHAFIIKVQYSVRLLSFCLLQSEMTICPKQLQKEVEDTQQVEEWDTDQMLKHPQSYPLLLRPRKPRMLNVELKSLKTETSVELKQLLKGIADSSWRGELRLKLKNSHSETVDCSDAVWQLSGAK